MDIESGEKALKSEDDPEAFKASEEDSEDEEKSEEIQEVAPSSMSQPGESRGVGYQEAAEEGAGGQTQGESQRQGSQ